MTPGPVCPCCGQPGGTCPSCGRDHSPALGVGECEQCCEDDSYRTSNQEEGQDE